MAPQIVALESTDTFESFRITFYGDEFCTIVTRDAGIVTEWVRELDLLVHQHNFHGLIIGLDIGIPPYSVYRPPVATLQLCAGAVCLIYQLKYADRIPDSLIDFIANKNHVIVGVDIYSKLVKLAMDHDFEYVLNAVDLRVLSAALRRRSDLRNAEVEELARAVLGKNMEKPASLATSPWGCRLLTDAQLTYASLDAFVAFEIGRVLNAPDHPEFKILSLRS